MSEFITNVAQVRELDKKDPNWRLSLKSSGVEIYIVDSPDNVLLREIRELRKEHSTESLPNA